MTRKRALRSNRFTRFDWQSKNLAYYQRHRPRASRVIALGQMNDYWVYILTNLPRRTVLYIGVTNSLKVRLAQHREGNVRGFAWRNNTFALVYYERFPEPHMAIEREKQLKRWRRSKKEMLIQRFNPEWRDLGAELFEDSAADVAGV